MDEIKRTDSVGQISLIAAIAIYGALAGMLVVCYRLAVEPSQISLGALAGYYFASGIVLNIIVLRRLVQWHEMYNTIDNVAGAKVRMILLWPLAYPFLFIKILIVKFL